MSRLLSLLSLPLRGSTFLRGAGGGVKERGGRRREGVEGWGTWANELMYRSV